MTYLRLSSILLLALATALTAATPFPANPREKHLRNLRQLTFSGSNAEAYWSADSRSLIFQSTRDAGQCDQIYTMRDDGSELKRVSTGQGRCTCSYFFPDGKRIVYASTHLGSADCPPVPDRSHGYVWPLYPTYDLFTARPDGSDVRRITSAPGYDAEATASPDGKRLVFTSVRDGDLELYTCGADGSAVRRLTFTQGYDGGAFFSHDGTKIVYRAFHPQTATELVDYRRHLAAAEYRPEWLELMVMNADGSHQRQVTNLHAASFCPFYFPGDHRIIFSSNHGGKQPYQFNLWAIDEDGTNLEQITFQERFEGFPMFSPDGKRIAWGSNRNSTGPHQTNVFVADWVP